MDKESMKKKVGKTPMQKLMNSPPICKHVPKSKGKGKQFGHHSKRY